MTLCGFVDVWLCMRTPPPFPHAGEEDRVVSTPPFAESVTEGDVKWEKGEVEGGGRRESR